MSAFYYGVLSEKIEIHIIYYDDVMWCGDDDDDDKEEDLWKNILIFCTKFENNGRDIQDINFLWVYQNISNSRRDKEYWISKE